MNTRPIVVDQQPPEICLACTVKLANFSPPNTLRSARLPDHGCSQGAWKY